MRKFLPAFCLALSFFGCSCTSPASGPVPEPLESPLTVLTIGTADSGGTMYPVGAAIAQAITEREDSVRINVSASSGSQMNVKDLASGEIDLGLVSGDVAYAAFNGLDEFSSPVKGLRAIAAVYSSSSNWIAPRSIGITYVNELKEMRIGVGPQDSTTELSARIAVKTLGWTARERSLRIAA